MGRCFSLRRGRPPRAPSFASSCSRTVMGLSNAGQRQVLVLRVDRVPPVLRVPLGDGRVRLHLLEDVPPADAGVVRAEADLAHLRAVRDDAHLGAAEVVVEEILEPHPGDEEHAPLVVSASSSPACAAPVWLRNCLSSVRSVEARRAPSRAGSGGGALAATCASVHARPAACVEDRREVARGCPPRRGSRAAGPSACVRLLTKSTVPMPQFGWQPQLSWPQSLSGPSSRSTTLPNGRERREREPVAVAGSVTPVCRATSCARWLSV